MKIKLLITSILSFLLVINFVHAQDYRIDPSQFTPEKIIEEVGKWRRAYNVEKIKSIEQKEENEKEISTLKESGRASTKEISDLKKQNNELDKKIIELETMTKGIDSIKLQLLQKQGRINNLEEIITQRNITIKHINDSKNNTYNENISLRAKLKQEKHALTNLKTNYTALEKEKKWLITEKEEQAKLIVELKKDIQRLETENKNLTVKVEELENINIRLERINIMQEEVIIEQDSIILSQISKIDSIQKKLKQSIKITMKDCTKIGVKIDGKITDANTNKDEITKRNYNKNKESDIYIKSCCSALIDIKNPTVFFMIYEIEDSIPKRIFGPESIVLTKSEEDSKYGIFHYKTNFHDPKSDTYKEYKPIELNQLFSGRKMDNSKKYKYTFTYHEKVFASGFLEHKKTQK